MLGFRLEPGGHPTVTPLPKLTSAVSALATSSRSPHARSNQHPPQTPSLTTERYAHDTLASAAKRLGRLISYHELYYPRSHHGAEYIAFRQGYLSGFESVLAGLARGTGAQTIHWTALCSEIRDAAHQFLEKLESLDAEKQERLARRRLRPRSRTPDGDFSSPTVSRSQAT